MNATRDGGCGAQGATPGFFYRNSQILICLNKALFFAFLFCLGQGISWASPVVAPQAKSRVQFRPYVPEKTDYMLSLGSAWENRTLYWIGAGVGWHLGRCVFNSSQLCQQYWDLLVGASAQQFQSMNLYLTGPRWQLVDFPDRTSFFLRVLGGVARIQDDDRDLNQFTAALAPGFAISLHERVDLSMEARVGHADVVWSQLLFSVHIKMERWLGYFSDRLQKLSEDTVESTGGVVRGTMKKGTEVMGEVIAKPIQKATESTKKFLSPSEEKKEKSEKKNSD